MNLKQISNVFLALIVAIVSFSSCNNDSTTTSYATESADAQIYKFSLSAAPYTAADTTNYAILKTTSFVIDQANQVIYNPDSLPYQIHLKKFAASISFSSSSPSAVSLTLKGVLESDSTISWNTTDSIDFSILRTINVTPQNGNSFSQRVYTINLRVHQIDPDTILWTKKPSLSNGATSQKTILKDNSFYCYSLKGGSLSLNVFDKTLNTWSSMVLVTPPSSIILQSITLFQNKFYAINSSGHSFRSNDGLTWSDLGNHNVTSILGVLPAQNTDGDRLAVVVNSSPSYIATTKDMNIFEKASEISDSDIQFRFPASGFSSVTNYNRNISSLNQLIVTGGKDFNGVQSNLTWLLRYDENNKLQKAPSQINNIFDAAEGLEIFLYNDSLYTLANNLLYISTNWGINWTKAPSKQQLDPSMLKTTGQSVIIDSDKYIWIFGSKAGSPIEVWRGRLNKLNPKL